MLLFPQFELFISAAAIFATSVPFACCHSSELHIRVLHFEQLLNYVRTYRCYNAVFALLRKWIVQKHFVSLPMKRSCRQFVAAAAAVVVVILADDAIVDGYLGFLNRRAVRPSVFQWGPLCLQSLRSEKNIEADKKCSGWIFILRTRKTSICIRVFYINTSGLSPEIEGQSTRRSFICSFFRVWNLEFVYAHDCHQQSCE